MKKPNPKYCYERQRGERQRRRIVQYLRTQSKPVRYADIAAVLGISITATFWHVQTLRHERVIAPTPVGKQRAIRLMEAVQS